MSTKDIINLVMTLLCVAAYAGMMYFKVKGDLAGAVAELISEAEKTGLAGSEKMKQVVQSLAKLVPAPFNLFLNEETITIIAQKAFDWMRMYANNYIASLEQQDEDEANKQLFHDNAETTASILVELIELSTDKLFEKARALGIEINDTMTRDELIKEIVIFALKKA